MRRICGTAVTAHHLTSVAIVTETSIVASQPQVTSSSVVQSSSPTTDSMALQKEKEVSFSSIFTSAPGLLSSFGDPLAKEDEAISTSGWGWDTQEMGASASEMLSGMFLFYFFTE